MLSVTYKHLFSPSLQPSINTSSTSPSLHRPAMPSAEAKPSPVAAPHPEGAFLSGRPHLEHDEAGGQLEALRSQMKELVVTVELLKAQHM